MSETHEFPVSIKIGIANRYYYSFTIDVKFRKIPAIGEHILFEFGCPVISAAIYDMHHYIIRHEPLCMICCMISCSSEEDALSVFNKFKDSFCLSNLIKDDFKVIR